MMEHWNLKFFIFIFSILLFLIYYKYSTFIGEKTGLTDKNKIPVLGGVYLYIGFILNHIYGYNELDKNWLIIDIYFISSVFFIALIDDKLDLNPYLRLIFLSIVIIYFIYRNDLFIYSINSMYLGFHYFPNNIFIKFLFPTFCIIVLLNAFNFTDGINGLASLIGISWFLYLIIKIPLILEVYLLFLLFLLFFLLINFSNKSYLGDSGNYIISTIIGSLILILNGKFPFIFFIEEIFLLLLVPGLDLIRLFYIRIKKRRSPLVGDLNHLHHLLVDKFSLRKALFIYILIINIPIYSYYLFNNLLIYIIILNILAYTLIIKTISKN